MIKLRDIYYVRIGTRDLARVIDFAQRVIGLELVGRAHGVATLRGAPTPNDAPHPTLVYIDGDPIDQTIGFELQDPADFHAAAWAIERAGQRVRIGTQREADARQVQQFISFRDPSGHRIEIVVRPDQSAARIAAPRDAGLTRLSHVGLRTSNASRDEAFWTRVCGLRVSDWIGEAALLRTGTRHHALALYPSSLTSIQHISFAVASFDELMRSWYFLREQGVRVLFGPGRDPLSGASFVYFAGPDKMIYAYTFGMRTIQPADEAAYRPRQFPFEPESFCEWGALPDITEFDASRRPLERKFAT
jgi:2,3-dihydroxy-p-cumate/2,3-dihydroxybenzoate 3,4-dioxygenase